MIRRITVFALALAIATGACAEPMSFRWGGSDARACEGDRPGFCSWVQASGDITAATPEAFRRFVAESEVFVPRLLRLDSQGGDLEAALAFGRLIRQLGFSTEVGADRPDAGNDDRYDGWDFTLPAPGVCASECAFAFLGGLDRYVGPSSAIGFNRFDAGDPPADAAAVQFTAAELVLYIREMGADAALIGVASAVAADAFAPLSADEARALRVIFEPGAWQPWTIAPSAGGIVASSRTADGARRVDVACDSGGRGFVTLTDTSPAMVAWLQSSAASGIAADGRHSVFGAAVAAADTAVAPLPAGGAAIRFALPDLDPPLTTPALLHPDAGYFSGGATLDYAGTTDGFEEAIRLALRNCTAT
ncbi:MAG: hypothetical protein KIS96_10930 [Bauldia sp.]|nr:hypothetical protein [Bauldia sp.]